MADHAGQPVRGLGGSMQVLLLGGMCVLLQQVPIRYRIDFFGQLADASLIHLHTGLLLAIAMLVRDRRVVAGCFAMAFAGWTLRQLYLFDDGRPTWMLAWGAGSYLLQFAWTLVCAHWMEWPRNLGARLHRPDLLRFAAFGLLLYPLGMALIGLSIMLVSSQSGAVSTAFQMFFAKQFGVVVVTLPLVIGWLERRTPTPRADVGTHWLLPVVLGLGLLVSLWAAVQVRHAFNGLSTLTSGPVLMDYRFAVLVVLAWCMLRLPPRWAMLALSLTLLLLVGMVAGTAEYANTSVGFFNLLHIAVELNILLLAMMYLWLTNRDRFELAERLSSETLRDQITGLPNLKALRERVARPLARTELG